MDIENYKEMLAKTQTVFEIWSEDTNWVVDVENDDACFSIYFDKYTGIAVSTRVYSKVYSD